jgi:hypothetical protein
MRLHEWQFYWPSWHFGCSKPYPDNGIKYITHWLVFIGPLQLWFYL